ncbi:unnamed protein product [Effrenium voratum]|uniref:Uncharacterized protein n=1 Tax=Effrenium voratum TaxID=2562239 RepID=A0AA36I7J1_9DINO|nr:unnamed protein product [Effrenium voratum]
MVPTEGSKIVMRWSRRRCFCSSMRIRSFQRALWKQFRLRSAIRRCWGDVSSCALRKKLRAAHCSFGVGAPGCSAAAPAAWSLGTGASSCGGAPSKSCRATVNGPSWRMWIWSCAWRGKAAGPSALCRWR